MCSKMRHKVGSISLTNSLSIKTGLSNIVEGCCFYFLVWGALIVAIIQSFRADASVRDSTPSIALIKVTEGSCGFSDI